jgi:hypothetical protein
MLSGVFRSIVSKNVEYNKTWMKQSLLVHNFILLFIAI